MSQRQKGYIFTPPTQALYDKMVQFRWTSLKPSSETRPQEHLLGQSAFQWVP